MSTSPDSVTYPAQTHGVLGLPDPVANTTVGVGSSPINQWGTTSGGGLSPISAFSVLANTGTASATPSGTVLDPANFIVNTPGTISTSGTVASINVTAADGYRIAGQVAFTIDANGNVSAGFHAGENNVGILNTFIGQQAGQYNTTGGENTYVGQIAGQYNTTGIMNTAIGEHAFGYDQTGSYNVFVGNDSGRNSGNSSMNVAVGKNALYCGGGGKNTVIGSFAYFNNNWHVAVGGSVTSGDTVQLTFTGSYTGSPQTISVTTTGLTLAQITDALRTAYNANATVWRSGTTGCFVQDSTNLVFSFPPSDAMVVTGNVTGAATETLTIAQGPTSDTANIAIGYGAMPAYYLTTGNTNIAIGENTLYSATSANFNIAIGSQAGYATTTATRNILIGDSAGAALTTSGSNVIIGPQAGTLTTGANGTLIGYRAGWKLTTGNNNTVVGHNALTNATTAANNTVVGMSAMGSGAATGQQNAVFGYTALQNQASSLSFTTAIGAQAMASYTGNDNNTPNANVAVGFATFNGSSGSGVRNTVVGGKSANVMTSASDNTFVGNQTGLVVTTGGNNTIIGSQVAKTTLATGTGNILIGVDSNTDTASSSTSNTLQIRGSGASVTPVIQATGINGLNPKVAIAAGTGAVAPVAGTDIPDKTFMAWKNTGDGTVKLYFNDGGSLKSVALT